MNSLRRKSSLVFCLSCCSLLISAAAIRGQSPIEPADIAKLQYASHPVVSPNGERMAYNLSVPRIPLQDDDGRAWSELHVTDLEGNSRPYITGKVSIGSPVWSSDSKYIYYTARRTDDTDSCLYRIPIDGGESQRVISWDRSIGAFSLHPDGKRVAFLAAEKDGDAQEKLKNKGFNQEIYEEDWKNTKIWLAEFDSDSEPTMLECEGSVSQIAYDTTGKRLLVVTAPTPSVDDSYMAKQVRVVEVDSGDVVAQMNHQGKLGSVAWSPDDKHIAMIAGADIHDPKDGRLMVAEFSAGTMEPHDLMPDYEAHINSFAWTSSTEVTWTAGEGTLSRVGKVSLEHEQTTLVAPDAELGIFSDIAVSQEGQQASLLGHSRSHYLETFLLPLASTQESLEPKRLTNSNPWLSEREFARQETIEWTAKDGLKLQGVLVYPIDYREGTRYPMIMVVHGGPEAHESDGWVTAYSKPGHMGAARGFFVFYPNYRGSTGRGVEFSKMGQADAAGKEFDDLVDAIDHLADKKLIDATRVGITGGSYGGYASAWGATFYSDRYAASVMFVGISDNLSKIGTTDIPEEMFLVHARKRLWDDWDYFLRSSPIRYVERNQTPTLILHGKEDPRVHPSQSLELHRHLKTLGQAPVRLVLYEGEGHGNRKAAARFDYCLRQIRWMEHFLKGEASEPPSMEIDYRKELGQEGE